MNDENGKSNTGDHIDIQEIQEFLSNVDGIESFVLVEEEGFPIAYKGLTQDEAEALAAMAVDVRVAMEALLVAPITQVFRTWNPRTITIGLEGGKTIEIARIRSLLATIKGKEDPVEEASRALSLRGEGKPVKCPYCSTDLTLKIYECNRCKHKVPFTARICPYCGANLRVKLCPNCNKPVTSDGQKATISKSKDARVIAGLEGLAGGVASGVIILAATSNLLLSTIIGVAIGAGIAKIVYDRLS